MLAAIDNWLFLILIAVAALFRLLAKAAGATKTSEPPEQSSPSPANPGDKEQQQSSSNEEQIRKFLEALGQPRSATVPPPVRPRTDVPARPVAPVRPPPSMVPVSDLRKLMPASGKAAETGRQREEFGLPQKGFEPKPPPPVKPRDVPVYEVDIPSVAPELPRTARPAQPAGAELQAAGKSAGADAIQLLRNPQSLRQAIILREIFGPPRSLQPLEDLPGTA